MRPLALPLHLLLASAPLVAADGASVPAPVASSAAAPAAAELTITVNGMHSATGHLRMALFDQATGYPEDVSHARATANLPIATAADGSHQTQVHFPGLPPGTYAIVCFHDENDNNHFDKNWLGVPKEGWAVSNNIRPDLRAPTFAEAHFTIAKSDLAIAVTIVY